MENKKASRYLAYDSLKGLKEAIVSADEFTTREKYPYSLEDDRNDMDIILYRSYLRGEMILISYYYKGRIHTIEDMVSKIDPVNHKLILMKNGGIYMAQIVGLKGKD